MHLNILYFVTGLLKKWLMMPLECLPLIPAGVRVSEVRAAARSQTSLGQRQLSVLSEFLLSAKIVRNGASSISLARRSARSGLSPVSRPHSVESPPVTTARDGIVFACHEERLKKGFGYWEDIERLCVIMRTLYWNIEKAHLKKDTNF